MEIVVRDEWSPSNSLEIFYTRESRHIFYKENSVINIKDLEDPSSKTSIDVGVFHCAFLSLSIDANYKVLAFQLCPSELVFLNTDNSSIVRKKCEGKVVGYHWLAFDKSSEFLVFTSSKIELLSVRPSGIYTVDFFQVEVGSYWYNQSSGIIAVALKPPNQGEVCLFRLVHNSSPSIQYLGNIRIDISEIMNNYWEANHSNKNCLSADTYHKDFLILLEKIYDDLFFIYLNAMVGILELTNLNAKKVKKIQVKPGLYNIKIVDNLIILMSFSTKISFIIDLKSNKYRAQPIAIVVHADSPLVSSILHEKKELFGYPLPYNAVQSLLSMNSHLLPLDKDLSLDMTGKVYQSVIIPDVIAQGHPNGLESVFFLYRREGCKMFMLKHLKNLMEDKFPIADLMKIFNKAKISQAEMYTAVFKPLLKVNLLYLLAVLTSYVNSVYANKRSLNISIGLLLAKVCIQLDKLELLYDLIQCHVIKDTAKLVSLLKKNLAHTVGRQYQAILLILSDLLFRLKDHHDLSKLLMEHQCEYENVFFLYRHSILNLDTENVCKYVSSLDYQ